MLEETGIAAKGVMMVERRIRAVSPCSEEGMRIAVGEEVSLSMAVLGQLIHDCGLS